MDRVVHIEEGVIREIPAVPRLCDGLDLRKEKVALGDCNLYCEQEGRGTPLVLLHGGPGSTHHNFHPALTRAKDFARVIYYDQRGCGLSDYRPGKGYSVDQAVEDLDRLRRALGLDRWVLLGHSYGGFLAQYYATKHPERVQGLVLVCASTGLHVESLPPREHQFISREEHEKMNQVRGTPGLSIAQIVYNIHLNGDWKRQSYYKPTREQIAQTALYGCVHDVRRNFSSVMSRSEDGVDLEGAFTQCPLPTLILEGRWDMSWNTDKPGQLQKNHPRAKLVMFEASAHDPFEDEPEAFFATLRAFVESLPPVADARLDAWKTDLAQWRQTKAKEREARRDPVLATPISPEETRALAEFRRLQARVRAGEKYEDATTPLHAVLTQMSQWKQRNESEDFLSQEVFCAPLPPEKPDEGSVWPVFAGAEKHEDTFIVVYWRGQWVWFGNLGSHIDWRLHKPMLEKLAREKLERQAAKDRRPPEPQAPTPAQTTP